MKPCAVGAHGRDGWMWGRDRMAFSEATFEKMAEVAVRVGVNVQRGQKVVVSATVEAADLVRAVAKKAYEAGARDVITFFVDERTSQLRFLMAPEEAMEDFPHWIAAGFEDLAREGAAFLSVAGRNPDLLKDVPPERVAVAAKTEQKAMEAFRPYVMGAKVAWSIISMPTLAWARKVFPDRPDDEAVDRLWQAIQKASRIDVEDPVLEWKEHTRRLSRRAEALNEARIRSLRYRAPGTDLTIDLPETHLWVPADQRNQAGTMFVANIPTEEVFTLPAREGVNGRVRATRPLVYGGTTVENLSLEFREGRVVDFGADEGYETLKQLIEMDEGSHYLGEIALVPVDSPISGLGMLFYNTLFDENASCHLALGRAYPFCLKDGDAVRSDADMLARGGNVSLTHVDFMMGSPELDIDAETVSGEVLPIFRQGTWARGL